jgi:DNA invertase Pin-like site-specific DNA recombinase
MFNPLKNRAAMYTRSATSSDEVMTQMESIEAYAKEHGLEIPDQFYWGEVFPDTTPPVNSDALFFLLKAAKRHEFLTVLMTDLGRLPGNPEQAEKVLQELKGYGLEVITTNDGVKVVDQTKTGPLFS